MPDEGRGATCFVCDGEGPLREGQGGLMVCVQPCESGRTATPLEVLTEARLTSRRVMMDDGYPSIVQRSREEAAQVALDALAEAGYEVVRRG